MEEYFSQDNVIDVEFWETNLRKVDSKTEIDLATQCDDQISIFTEKCFPKISHTENKNNQKLDAIYVESERCKLLNFDFIASVKLSRTLKAKPLKNCSNSELKNLMLYYNNDEYS